MSSTQLAKVNYYKGLVFGPRGSFNTGFVKCRVAGGGPQVRKVYVTSIEERVAADGREYQVGVTELQAPADLGTIERTFNQEHVIERFTEADNLNWKPMVGRRTTKRKRTGFVYRGVRAGTPIVRHRVQGVGQQNGRFVDSSIVEKRRR